MSRLANPLYLITCEEAPYAHYGYSDCIITGYAAEVVISFRYGQGRYEVSRVVPPGYKPLRWNSVEAAVRKFLSESPQFQDYAKRFGGPLGGRFLVGHVSSDKKTFEGEILNTFFRTQHVAFSNETHGICTVFTIPLEEIGD